MIDIVGSVLERPLIKNEFTAKYVEIIVMLKEELITCEVSDIYHVLFVITVNILIKFFKHQSLTCYKNNEVPMSTEDLYTTSLYYIYLLHVNNIIVKTY